MKSSTGKIQLSIMHDPNPKRPAYLTLLLLIFLSPKLRALPIPESDNAPGLVFR